MKAWTHQDDKQVKKHGEARASWYVSWLDPDGKRRCKSCGPGPKGKRDAEKEADRIHSQIVTKTYQSQEKKTWKEFRAEFEEKVVAGLAVRSREEFRYSLNNYERLMKPGKVLSIKTAAVDEFIAKRRREPSKKGGPISPATLNKDLRHLRAALAVAVEWEYLAALPKFRMEKVPEKLATYVSAEHFAAIYQAVGEPRFPRNTPYPAADWWRALLITGYMTGWRKSEILALRRDDLDLDAGVAITRAADNKGKRDEAVKLHPIVVEHLRLLHGFDPLVFPWPHSRVTLYPTFAAIQERAKIHLPCPDCTKEHKHSRYCFLYGLHDLRRAFATMNASKLTPDALQALMRHKSYSTTKIYINVARQLDEAVAGLHVPEFLRQNAAQ